MRISTFTSTVRGAVISGNSIHLATSHDVLIENSSEVLLTDTVLDRHPRYNPDRKTNGGPMRHGIVIRKSSRCTLSALRVNGGKAAAAIEISGGELFSISDCTITDVEAAALQLDGVRDSVITGNILAPSARENLALRVRGGAGNMIQGNLVRGRTEIDATSTAARAQ